MASNFEISTFKQVMGRFATGVTVVTMQANGLIHGMTANAFCSVSLDPPLVLVCVGKHQHTHRLMSESRRYAVNMLRTDQEHISNYFARPRPEGQEEFEGIATHSSPGGMPYIDGCLAYADCKVVDILPGGDHDIFIGEVEHLDIPAPENPLLYYKGKYRRLAE